MEIFAIPMVLVIFVFGLFISNAVNAAEQQLSTEKSTTSPQSFTLSIPVPLKIEGEITQKRTQDEVAAAQKEDTDRQQLNAENLVVAKSTAKATWYASYAAWIAAVAAICSAIIASGQLLMFRKSLKQTSDTVNLTRASVALTKESLNIEVNPYLYISLELIDDSVSLTQASADTLYGITPVSLGLKKFRICISNAGRSPARITNWYYKLIVVPSGQEISHAIDVTKEMGHDLPSIIVAPDKSFGETITFSELTNKQLESVANLTSSIWVCGFFRYKNTLGSKYILGFNYVFDLPFMQFVQRGSGAYNYENSNDEEI
jgi:hypothetical protein